MSRKIPPHLLAVFMLGAVSQIGQVLFMREMLMVFHGNELSIGLILSGWLLWVGVGSHVGGLMVTKKIGPRILLLFSSLALMVLLPATILLIRGLRGFLGIFPGAYLSLGDMIVSCFVLMAPACLVFGAKFVFLSRVWRESLKSEDTSGAQKTYIGEAAGTMLGGIAFTFLMVHYLTPLQGAVLAASAMLIAVFLLTEGQGFTVAGFWLSSSSVAIGFLAIAVLLFPQLRLIDDWAYKGQWQQFAPGYELLETEHSKHGIISVARRQDQYSFYQSGHLIFSTAGSETTVPGFEEADAVDFAHLAMVQHENPERVLLIGGGLRGVLSEVLEHPVQRVDYVELDEVLTEVARPYVPSRTQSALDDPRVNLIHEDGRLFVKTTDEEYNLVIVDKPDPFTAELNRYYTEEFFREIRSLLCSDGTFVTGVMSTPDLRGTGIANRNSTIYHTLRRVFSDVLLAGERTMFFFASDAPGQISVDASRLEQRYDKREIEAAAFSSRRYHTLLEDTQLRRINWVVRTHGRRPQAHLKGVGAIPPSPASVSQQQEMEPGLPPVCQDYFVNTDFQPIGYFYTLLFWENLTRDDIRYSLQQLLHVESWWIGPAVAVFLLLAFALRAMASDEAGRKRLWHFAVLFTVFTTGLSTMALQIALLFSFQSVYGFVYEMVGLITAIFMGGLSIGAWLTHRYISDKVKLRTLAFVQLLMALLAVVVAVLLPEAARIQFPAIVFSLFSMLTFMAGLINGIDFPLAVSCYMALRRQADESTGVVYGVELFGACSGAIFASVLVAPIFGIVACCLMAAIASGAAALILWVSRGVAHV